MLLCLRCQDLHPCQPTPNITPNINPTPRTPLQWDLWAGISLSVLLLLALPSSIQRQHWRMELVAFVAEVTFRVLPAWLATLATASYLPRRTPIVAACRLASVVVPRLVVQPPLPIGAWGGWAQYLLFTRALGVNTLPWLARLPFKVGEGAPGALQKLCIMRLSGC